MNENPQNPQQPEEKKNSPLSVIGSILFIALLIGGLSYGPKLWDKLTGANVEVGDCLQDVRGGYNEDEKDYKQDCESEEARYKVTAIHDKDSQESCIDVAGTTNALTVTRTNDGDKEHKVFCLTEKDAKPEEGINLLTEGDCMIIDGYFSHLSEGKKAECGEPEAQEILGVLNQSKNSGTNFDQPEEEEVLTRCRENGHRQTKGYFALSMHEGDKDTSRTWCLAAAKK